MSSHNCNEPEPDSGKKEDINELFCRILKTVKNSTLNGIDFWLPEQWGGFTNVKDLLIQ